MNNKEIVFNLRKRIFNEWRYKRYTHQEVKAKYGFGKTWFYKWLKRFLKYGEEGLRDKERSYPSPHPQELSHQEKEKILNYVYDNPTHGPDRISRELDFKVSGKTVWKLLKKKNLNTRRKRRLWAYSQGKLILTDKEIRILSAKKNHIDSKEPGELISMDTFWCNIKSLGRIYQYTGCDTYSSYGWAKAYLQRTGNNAIDFFENHMLKNVPEGKIKRILTDKGIEFYSARHKDRLVNHCFTEYLMTHGIVHSVTKTAHPWTNGYAERIIQTIWEEFYLCRLSKPYYSIDELNKDLEEFMRYYNWKRLHCGYKLVAGGYKTPGHAFYDIRERESIIEIKY